MLVGCGGKSGGFLVIPTVLVQLPFTKSSANKVGIISIVIVSFQLLTMLLTIIAIEKAFKTKFNDDGTGR